jgi:heme oxygenase (mycobilin-producing)
MTFVAINILEVPQNMGKTLEERFARRAGEVEKMEGFEAFELLRPLEGTDRYLVYTRWQSKAAFTAWVSSAAFTRGHAQHAEGGPAASGSELWTFEVAQATAPRRE